MPSSLEAEVDRALELAMGEPHRALEIARRIVLYDGVPDLVRVRAGWAIGLAERELGDLAAAHQTLEDLLPEVLDLDAILSVEVTMTWVSVLLLQGRTGDAIGVLEMVPDVDEARVQARLEMQRGLAHHRSGALDRAHDSYERAIGFADEAGDPIGEARARVNVGLLSIQRGDYADAERHLVRGRSLASTAGQVVTLGLIEHNLGYLRVCQGNLVEAFRAFDAAEEAFVGAGSESHLGLLLADHAAAALQANLLDEAVETSGRALALVGGTDNRADLAEIALTASRCRSAAGDSDEGLAAAQLARRAFEDAERHDWVPVARLVEFNAQLAASSLPASASDDVAGLIADLGDRGWTAEQFEACVLASRVHLAHGSLHESGRMLQSAARLRPQLSAFERVSLELGRAYLAEAAGDRSALGRAVGRGLDAIAVNQASLGAFELRARATAHAEELAVLGARTAMADREARRLLRFIDFARGMTALIPDPSPPADTTLAGSLEQLRTASSALREFPAPEERARLEERIAELEHSIRSLTRQSSGSGALLDLPVTAMIGELGSDVALIEFCLLDGFICAVTVVNGRASTHELVEADQLPSHLESLSFALHRLSRQNASQASIAAAMSSIEEASAALDALLVPTRLRRSDGPIVVVPNGRLHGITWRTLPSLRDRSLVVAPSLASWTVGRSRPASAINGAVVILGPGLEHAAAEVEAVRSVYDSAAVHVASTTTVAESVQLLEGAAVAHFACHGVFRSDNAVFSRLVLDDGDLNAFDLQQCQRLPPTIVLSACDAAQSGVVRGGGLLGLSAALIQLGVSSVIAPLAPVNDERSVDLMVRLHTHLAVGVPAAEALAKASVGPDGVLDPTAAPFICFGS